MVITWNDLRGAAEGSVVATTTGFACSSLSVSDWWKVLGKHCFIGKALPIKCVMEKNKMGCSCLLGSFPLVFKIS